jgi:hypothetical protein
MPSGGSRATRAPVTLGAVLTATVLLFAACSTNRTGGPTTSAPSSTPSTSRTTTTTGAAKPKTWSSPENVSRGVTLEAIVCPAANSCVALGPEGQAYRLRTKGWKGPISTSAATGATGAPTLSCPGTSFCMAVWRGTSESAVWNGKSWSAPIAVGGSQSLQAVGCATSTFCVAIDGIGDGFYFNGSSWSAGPNDWGSVMSISCPTSSFCVSVAGGVSMWNGSSWTEPQQFGTTSVLQAVSCPVPTFCAAVDTTGETIIWNGTKWSGPESLEGSSALGTPSLSGVSCSSTSFCVAVDSGGRAFTWSGRTWSAADLVDTGHALTAVSCTNLTFCVATDKQGFALTRT